MTPGAANIKPVSLLIVISAPSEFISVQHDTMEEENSVDRG